MMRSPTVAAADSSKILNHQSGMQYRPLGDTGMHLSVITLGGLVISEPVHHYAIEHGVNLVHISRAYLGGQAIRSLSNVLKTKRDRVYVAVKDDFDDIDGILKALNTEYIDFLMFARHNERGAGDPGVREAFEKYRQQGKVRYAGLTTHGEVKAGTGVGISSGMYSIVMPALNQPNLEAMGEELRQAAERGVGVMAMKAMRGLKGLDLELAYLKKLLRNPAVTTVLKGIGSFEMFDAYRKASSEALASSEDRALYRYAQANRSENCMSCDDCRLACPEGVEISTILRCRDYYYAQEHDLPTALDTYASIPPGKLGSEACRDCALCEAACPNGIRIVNRLLAANRLFASLA